MIKATVVADSLNVATGDRITTVNVTFPRCVLSELVTHRLLFVDTFHDLEEMLKAYDADIPHSLSKNAASSRAVPIKTMIDRLDENSFMPQFRTAKKGMASGEPVAESVQEIAETQVNWAMKVMVQTAELLAALGIEKGQANRYLEPFSHIEVLLTATEWKNFLLLRDHEAAQVEIRELAQAIRKAIEASTPETLQPGEWHMPFESYDNAFDWESHAMISAARCARISYKSLATMQMAGLMENLELFKKLTAGNPKHLSPLEHPAQAQDIRQRNGNLVGWKSLRKVMFPVIEAGGDLKEVKEL